MGGMSEFTMILDHYSVDWRIGYLAFTAGIVAWLRLLGASLLDREDVQWVMASRSTYRRNS